MQNFLCQVIYSKGSRDRKVTGLFFSVFWCNQAQSVRGEGAFFRLAKASAKHVWQTWSNKRPIGSTPFTRVSCKHDPSTGETGRREVEKAYITVLLWCRTKGAVKSVVVRQNCRSHAARVKRLQFPLRLVRSPKFCQRKRRHSGNEATLPKKTS